MDAAKLEQKPFLDLHLLPANNVCCVRVFCSYFSDIFEIIDHVIMMAASDCPKEFRLRRDRIADMLFSC
ncbi:hypothetical protein HN51_063365, partial [Arachis hypogaea]